MSKADPPRLLGSYAAPQVRVGHLVRCELRGEVEVVGMSAGPISWPIGKHPPRGRQRFLIVTGDLVQAIRRESAQAIGYWWRISHNTVLTWRKALGVGAVTEGTARLKRENALSEGVSAGRAAAAAKARDPEQDKKRRQKIADARRGKPRRPEDVAPAHTANRGRKHTEEARRKMREAHKRKSSSPSAIP